MQAGGAGRLVWGEWRGVIPPPPVSGASMGAKMDERQGPVLLAALSVALRARMGGLTAEEVSDMRVRAEELLDRGSSLRAAVFSFATMYELHRRDPAALVVLGEELDRGLSRALRPDPVDLSRRDIHG